MSLTDYKIKDSDILTKGVVAAPDKLTGTAAQNKAVFDRLIREALKGLFNGLIDALTETISLDQSAIAGKMDAMEIDDEPTPGSENLITSGAVAAELEDLTDYIIDLYAVKQDLLVFDSAPTPNSGNAITSGAVDAALATLREEIDNIPSSPSAGITLDDVPEQNSKNAVEGGGIWRFANALQIAAERRATGGVY